MALDEESSWRLDQHNELDRNIRLESELPTPVDEKYTTLIYPEQIILVVLLLFSKQVIRERRQSHGRGDRIAPVAG